MLSFFHNNVLLHHVLLYLIIGLNWWIFRAYIFLAFTILPEIKVLIIPNQWLSHLINWFTKLIYSMPPWHINAEDYDERNQLLLEYQQLHQPYFLNLVASNKSFLIFEFLILFEHTFAIVSYLFLNLVFTF